VDHRDPAVAAFLRLLENDIAAGRKDIVIVTPRLFLGVIKQ
jgi:hypothetical protein